MHVRKFQPHVSVCRPCAYRAVGTVDLDVPIHRAQFFHFVNAGDSKRPVHCAEVLHFRAMRHVDRIFHRYLHAFVLRIAGRDRNSSSAGVDVDGDALQVRFLQLCSFHRVNFHHVAIPTLHFHRAIHVLQLKLAARLQRIRLIELLADGEARNGCNRQRAYQHRRRKDQLAKSHKQLLFEGSPRIRFQFTASPNCAVVPPFS